MRRNIRWLLPVVAALAVACGGSDDDAASDEDAAAPAAPASRVESDSPRMDGDWYRPAIGATWQWQLDGTVNASYDVDMYDIDLFDSDETLIAALHADGRRVICYFSAGSAENWRSDFGRFDETNIGKPLDGWEGERWLDIRSEAVREVMLGRLDLASAKGCDGVEPDNVQAYDDDTGFPLTVEDQLAFNRFLANEAHARGLAVGLKNGGPLAAQFVEYFDFVLNEQCHEYEECGDYAVFVQAGKPVFNVEYADDAGAAIDLMASLCPQAQAAELRTLILPLDLDDSFRVSCEDAGA